VAGICSAGADAVVCGVIPIRAVAYLTKLGAFDAGAVISASHNSFEFNGIKLFDRDWV
jgi:phosphoglucosamine mutase